MPKAKTGNKEYTASERAAIFNKICDRISDGLSLRKALLGEDGKRVIGSDTFFRWIEEDATASMSKQYTRVCEERHEILAEQVVELGLEALIQEEETEVETDKGSFRTVKKFDNVQRAKAAQFGLIWYLGKVAPKKYGNKTEEATPHVEQPLFNDID